MGKQIDGQISLCDEEEPTFPMCFTCENCGKTQLFDHFCKVKRTILTSHSGSFLCHNEHYKRKK